MYDYVYVKNLSLNFIFILCSRVSRLLTKNINHTHRGQSLMPDSQIGTNCSLTNDWWKKFNSISPKLFPCWLCVLIISQFTKIVAFEIASEVLKGLWNNFYYFRRCRKSSENHQTYLEVDYMFLENLVMTEWKSHAFDSEKVGRYNKLEALLMDTPIKQKVLLTAAIRKPPINSHTKSYFFQFCKWIIPAGSLRQFQGLRTRC